MTYIFFRVSFHVTLFILSIYDNYDLYMTHTLSIQDSIIVPLQF